MSEDYPNYVWVGFDKDCGEPKQVHPVKPHGDYLGDLFWQMYFPAEFMRKHSSTVAELEKELSEQCRLNGIGSEREAKLMAEAQKLRLALSMYSSERMRLGSTVTPKWADDALASSSQVEGEE